MSKPENRKKIAVIRALDIRLIQAEFTASFRKLEASFVSNLNSEIANYLQKKKIKHFQLKLIAPYLIDPISLMLGHSTHQSWLYFEKKRLEEVLKPIDVYQIQESFFHYSQQVAGIAEKFNKPLVMAPWISFNHSSTYIPPYCFNVKKAIQQTDLFILRSERVNKYLLSFKIPTRKKVLIYHGINIKRFYPEKKSGNGKVRILFTGMLEKNKGIDDLLDLFPRLIKASRKNIELVICGKGKYENEVIQMAKTLPIKYLGYIPNSDLPQIYQKSDIFCGPSKDSYNLGIKRSEEGFGFIFLEAIASGLPVVAYNSGAISEVLGKDNFLIKPGDKEGLLRSLQTLILDTKLRQQIGIKNRERAETFFDLEKQVEKEEDVILKRFF